MFVLKRSALAAAAVAVALVLLAGLCLSAVGAANTAPAAGFCVVLDAGHGGADPGVRGVQTAVKESEINLAIVLRLAEYLEGAGFSVVLTRKDAGGLYGALTDGYKKRDMQARREIIEAASPNAVISVHQNSFPADRSRRGGQVFFRQGHAAGESLASSIQGRLNALGGNDFSPLHGDYFMLNCTDYPSVIVECGFLSNAEDELLLRTESYREQVAYAVFCGVLSFFA